MRLELFDYHLPPDRIAQTPISPRDASRLLIVPATGELEHRRFTDFPQYLEPGDLLVFNDTRVLPARLHGVKETGARVEALLLVRVAEGRWEALVHPGRRLKEGARVSFGDGALVATVVGRGEEGTRLLQFEAPVGGNTDDLIHQLGKAPLPPYIHEELEDPERYQTIYAREEGSAAAPTAGLHFTPRVMEALRARGVGFAWVTLHVGIGTFRPVKTEEIEQHEMHAEWYSVPPETAGAVAACRGRIVAVGTTTLRCLESASEGERRLRVGSAVTRLYVTPGYCFQIADLLLTNFHMPRSSLLILVSAFSSRERIVEAYEAALHEGYRFLSFGDAMLLERPPQATRGAE